MRLIIIFSFFTTILFLSCKNDANKSTNSNKEQKNIQSDIEPQIENEDLKPYVKELDIVETRNEANSNIIEFVKGNNKASEYLTLNYYIVDYISDGKSGPKDMIDFGEWYKFEKDFTYKHGFFEEVEDEGKYIYNIDDKKALLLPNKKDKFPSEWKVLSSGDVIVFVGTSRFNNNPFQKHMQNVKEKPLVKR